MAQTKSIPISQQHLYENLKQQNRKKVIDYSMRGVKSTMSIRYNFKKVKDIDYRALSRIMEETYSRAYSLMLLDKNKHTENIHLSLFLYEFLKSKFKQMDDVVTHMFVSIVYSSYHYKEKYIDCDIFFKFMSGLYQPLELSYFVFLR